MSSRDTTVATRNARWVMVQRGSQIAGAVLFALIVPRWMGPDEFGRYALVTSISMSFALLSSMGAVSMMTRAVPGFVLRQDLAGLSYARVRSHRPSRRCRPPGCGVVRRADNDLAARH